MSAKDTYKSRVYTDRPAYADYEPAEKFEAIKGIIATRLKQHPKAICSYSGGSDSDIMIDLIEGEYGVRKYIPSLPPVKYVFFNTGLEMKATKDHVKATSEKYGVDIEEVRPKISIVQASREYGIPFASKAFSQRTGDLQRKNIPLSIIDEYEQAEDKEKAFARLVKKYPKSIRVLTFFCGCMKDGTPSTNRALTVNSLKYGADFIREYPPDFRLSAECCEYCKKQPAHLIQKDYEMIITGERFSEGGLRAIAKYSTSETGCFAETSDGKFRLRPMFYVSNSDKAWYKREFGVRYSDAYEVYGLTRTGCCGCPISYKAVEDLEKIRPFEPNVVKAAWNIFGKSYEYRAKYNEYKEQRKQEEQREADFEGGEQVKLDELMDIV